MWRTRCLRCLTTIPSFPRHHPTPPCFPRHQHRHILRHVVIYTQITIRRSLTYYTTTAIVSADAYSRRYEQERNPAKQYEDQSRTLQDELEAQKSTKDRTMDWLAANRYSVVFGSWVASMGTALGLVGRNPYLSTQQKLVQARVYAQGLTIAVVIISLAFEGTDNAAGRGRWETVKVIDPNDPEHKHVIEKQIHHEKYPGEDQWRDMVEAEEEKIKAREAAVKEREKKGKKSTHRKEDEENKTAAEVVKSKGVNAP